MNDFLKDDYALDSLVESRPWADDFSFLVTPRFKEVYERGYEKLSTRIFKNLVRKADLVFDIGANYGYYSVLAGKTNPEVEIIAVEPIEENQIVLEKNFQINGIKNARAIKGAASGKTGEIEFFKSEAADNSSVFKHPNAGTLEKLRVKAFALDELIEVDRYKSIVIKSDTDGNELEVLKGLKKTINEADEVSLLLEVNPKMLKLANESVSSLIELLTELGFALYAIDDEDYKIYPFSERQNILLMESLRRKSYYNLLCLKQPQTVSAVFFLHSATNNGSERSLLDLVQGLVTRGLICHVVFPAHGPMVEKFVELGCGVFYFPPDIARHLHWWWCGHKRPENLFLGKQHAANHVNHILLPELRRIKPDLVFTQSIVSPWGAFCAEALGIPHILSAREYGVLDHGLEFFYGFNESMDALYKTSEVVFTITKDLARVVFAGKKEKIKPLYSNVAANLNQVARKGKALDPAVGIKLGLFGTISPGKGQLELLEAVIQLESQGFDLKVVFAGGVGDEDYLSILKGRIEQAELKTHFEFPGFVSNPYGLMSEMDIIVSCSRREALGRTLLEAAILEIPIIYAEAGGPKEIFCAGKHGLAYAPGDIDELVTKISETIRDQAGTEKRIATAKSHVLEKFSDEAYSGLVYPSLLELKDSRKARRIQSHVGEFLHCEPTKFRPALYYSKTKDCYTGDQVIFSRDEISFGPFNCVFELDGEEEKYIRFDPLELAYCKILIQELVLTMDQREKTYSLDEIKDELGSNGFFESDDWLTFSTDDPQIVLPFFGKISKVKIIGVLEHLDASQLVTTQLTKLAEQSAQIAEQSAEISERDTRIVEQDARIAERETRITKQKLEKEELVAGYQEHVRQLELAVFEKAQELQAFFASKSWRITAPLRLIMRFLKWCFRLPKRILKKLYKLTKAVFRRLPLPRFVKRLIKSTTFFLFGWALKNTGEYKNWMASRMARKSRKMVDLVDHSPTSSRGGLVQIDDFKKADGLWEWKDGSWLRDQLTIKARQDLDGFTPTAPKLVSYSKNAWRKVASQLNFKSPPECPQVSIIIPVYNQLGLTLECLSSIKTNTAGIDYEIIIADDASTDETESLLAKIKGLRYLRNDSNLGFLKNCNRALKEAKGRNILYLNNDVQVLPGWLEGLLAVFEKFQDAGVVGPKVLYPSGHLQEAGCAFNKDGTAVMVGLNDDPEKPRYNYLREVDYVSGVCLLVRGDLIRELGGFDLDYAPCYCEDSDLCLRVRARGKKIYYTPDSVIVHHLSKTTASQDNSFKMQCVNNNLLKLYNKWNNLIDPDPFLRLIAFYLPQFHPFPENDLWWGKGFTEWANVSKAKPNFVGHYQPRQPADLGYYDLRLPEVMEHQAELAKRYGMGGFCFYYYWFAGKRLLERPIEAMLESGKPNFPFCLCWANENWTRRWDGLENDVLIAQNHGPADDLAVIDDLSRYFRDPRYIRIDGRPLVLVYRVGLFPDFYETSQCWRTRCRENGIGEIYLIMVESFEMVESEKTPAHFGCDASLEFPPHGLANQVKPSGEVINPEFKGAVADYRDLAFRVATRDFPNYPRHKGVMPGWDNTARRQDAGFCFENATPGVFQVWLEESIKQTQAQFSGDQRLIFINAWNEWAEGAYLEPDQRFGHTWLEAVRNALDADLLEEGNDNGV